jgi:histidine ammonia-lyase
VQNTRAFPQQARAAAIRRDLSDSYLWALSPMRPLQDPLSHRTFSHGLGGANAVLARVEGQLRVQINSSDDNPSVLLDVAPPAGATAQARSFTSTATASAAPSSRPQTSIRSSVVQIESLLVALGHVSAPQYSAGPATPEFTHLPRLLTADAGSIGFAAIQKIPAAMGREPPPRRPCIA